MLLIDVEKNKEKLIDAALFLLAYELLNSSIVDGVKSFFCMGFDEEGLKYSASYKDKVIQQAKHIYEASLMWLMEVEAINQADYEDLLDIRKYRNFVAHQIPEFVFSENKGVELGRLIKTAELVRKIEKFWVNVDIDINPDVDHVDRESAISGKTLILDYMISSVYSTR